MIEFYPDTCIDEFNRKNVDKFEKYLQASDGVIRFDESYLNFLDDHHGGSPIGCYFHTAAGVEKKIGVFFNFIPTESDDVRADFAVQVMWSEVAHRLDPTLMPFAELIGGVFLCFDYSLVGERPRIVVWCNGGPRDNRELVCESFDDFLKLIDC